MAVAAPTTNSITGGSSKATKKASAFSNLNQKFSIDCSKPVNDGVFDVALFEKFLHDKIKVENKTGNLGTNVVLSRSGSSLGIKTNGVRFPKRYIKYLTKKFLKKHALRDWLHVISSDKNSYQLKYFNINQGDDEEEKDDE